MDGVSSGQQVQADKKVVEKNLINKVDTFEEIQKSVKDDKLSLAYRDLTDNELELVCNFLNQHPEIKHLDVSYNKIGPQGAELLAANTTLTSLDIRRNRIKDEGVKALAQNTSITSLNVGYNYTTDEAANALSIRREKIGVGEYVSKGTNASPTTAVDESVSKKTLGM